MQLLSSLFGEKTLLFLGVFLALILLAAAAVALARAFGDRAGRALSSRSRQQRLGVVDAFDLDRQRQLVIIRRDNVEHLVMIGGPNDVVVESAIVRHAASNFPQGLREPPAPALPAQAAPAARQALNSMDGRPDFDLSSRGAGVPATPGVTVHAPPGSVAPPVAPAPATGSRLPFPTRPASPQRQPTRETAHAAPPPPPASGPPAQEPRVSPPPPVAAEPKASAPPPVVHAPALSSPPVASPAPQPRPAPQPLPRPTRTFPTLRPGGGPLFPVRSATPPPPLLEAEGRAPQPTPAPAPAGVETGINRQNALETFESLEEEMAKLLGRPSGGEG